MEDGLLYVIMSNATSFAGPLIGLVNKINLERVKSTWKEYCQQKILYHEGRELRPSFFDIYMYSETLS